MTNITVIAKDYLNGTSREIANTTLEALAVSNTYRNICKEAKSSEMLIIKNTETNEEIFLNKKY